MAKASSITPPFAWLGRFWAPVGLTLITLVAAFFRFYQLSTLPPGLDETAARIGTQAIALTWAHPFPQLNAANGYSPLWVWLQAVSIHAVGRTTVALLLISALLGTLSIIVTWFWLRDWFDTRIAWLGATTLAVSPWATTLSRSGLESVLPLFLYPLTLWLSSRALKSPSLSRYILVGLAMGLDVLSGPLGILFAAVLCFIAVLRLVAAKKLLAFSAVRLAGLGVFALALAVSGYLIGQSLTAVRALPHDLNIVSRMSDLVANFGKVLLMFNVHGDDNYRHNLAGEPMLNAFVGLMMVTGLLVSISRMHRLRYRVVLGLAFVMLLPAALSSAAAPDSSWAAGALPLIFALAAIGASYMLELWYATFPINSAARATGQAAIILLLALSMLQGYTQYFRAWAGSSAVYSSYNEGTAQIAGHIKTDKFNGERYVIVPTDQASIIQYLDDAKSTYQILSPSDLKALPVSVTNRQFFLAAATRDEVVKVLKAKFPGGVLRPHYSDFNQIEIYYTYEISK